MSTNVKLQDSMLLAGMTEPGYPVMNLEHLAVTRLHMKPWKAETKDADFGVLTPELRDRNMRDAVACSALREITYRKMAERKVTQWVNNEVLRTSINMTRRGIPIDEAEVDRQTEAAEKAAGESYARLIRRVPNPGSGQQIGAYLEPLIVKYGLPAKRTKTGLLQTDKTALSDLAAQERAPGKLVRFIGDLLMWKKQTKLLTGYLKTLKGWAPLARPDIFLTSIEGRGAVTGRITMELIQTFPRDGALKKCIVSSKPGGQILVADYKQVELLVAATIAGEDTMLRMIEDGVDLHAMMWREIKGRDHKDDKERQVGKRTNFATIYDVTPQGLLEQLWVLDRIRMDLETAKRCIDTFFRLFPRFRDYHARQRETVRLKKRVLSPTGRILRTSDARQGINAPVQSGGSDLNTCAMVLLDRADWRPLINQYDSVACDIRWTDVNHAEMEIRRIMCEATPRELERRFGWHFPVKPRVDIKVGPTWQ